MNMHTRNDRTDRYRPLFELPDGVHDTDKADQFRSRRHLAAHPATTSLNSLDFNHAKPHCLRVSRRANGADR